MGVDDGPVPPGATQASRVLAALSAFDADHPSLSLSEVSRRSGLPLTSTHRIVGELERWAALDRDERGKYHIGRRVWRLGTLAPVERGLRDVAAAPMQDLCVASQGNVSLAVRSEGSALFVERFHGRPSVAAASRPGQPLPLHATAAGKILLAHAPVDVVANYCRSLRPLTPRTIVDAAALRTQLAAARTNGWAQNRGESEIGTSALAVPVTDAGGDVIAALALAFPDRRFAPRAMLPGLLVTAAAVHRALTLAPAAQQDVLRDRERRQ